MKTIRWQVGVILLAMPTFASAAGVYKCVDAKGDTVYQASPCDPGCAETEISVHSASVPDTVDSALHKDAIGQLSRKGQRQYLERKITRCDKRMQLLKKRIDSIRRERERGGPKHLLDEIDELERRSARGVLDHRDPRASEYRRARPFGMRDNRRVQLERKIAKHIRDSNKKLMHYEQEIDDITEERKRLQKELAKLEEP